MTAEAEQPTRSSQRPGGRHAISGTLVNRPPWITGKIGKGLAFDATGSYVNVPQAASLSAYPPTVAAWIKTSATTGISGIMSKDLAGSRTATKSSREQKPVRVVLPDAANYVSDGTSCSLRRRGYAGPSITFCVKSRSNATFKTLDPPRARASKRGKSWFDELLDAIGHWF